MIDIAQLREALDWFDDLDGEYTDVLKAAAKELLTIREAGALIIVPDEDGKWPKWALLVEQYRREYDDDWKRYHDYRLTEAEFLDALRDAMPDGET